MQEWMFPLTADHQLGTAILSILALGLVTALNPCMLAMAPAAAGYVGGSARSGRQSLTLSLTFVLGYAATLAMLGLAAGLLGRALIPSGDWSKGLGFIYLGLGAYILFHRRVRLVPWRLAGFYYAPSWERLNNMVGKGTFLGALAMGTIFSLTPSPCATPVVLALLSTTAAAGEVFKSMALLFAFGVGHSALLFILSACAGLAAKRRAKRAWGINLLFGAALVFLGVYLLAGRMLFMGPPDVHTHQF